MTDTDEIIDFDNMTYRIDGVGTMTEKTQYAFQLSTKIGEDIVLVRGDSVNDVAEKWEDLKMQGDRIQKAIGDYKQVAIANSVFVSTGEKANTPAPSNDSPPRCKHGEMADCLGKKTKAGNLYKHRYYCTAKNRDEQCEARGDNYA